jgi:hypothetical protein
MELSHMIISCQAMIGMWFFKDVLYLLLPLKYPQKLLEGKKHVTISWIPALDSRPITAGWLLLRHQ